MAQMQLMQAQTEKTKAEAVKIAGADTQNTTADTAIKQATTEIQNVAARVANETEKQQIDQITYAANEQIQDLGAAIFEPVIDVVLHQRRELVVHLQRWSQDALCVAHFKTPLVIKTWIIRYVTARTMQSIVLWSMIYSRVMISSKSNYTTT